MPREIKVFSLYFIHFKLSKWIQHKKKKCISKVGKCLLWQKKEQWNFLFNKTVKNFHIIVFDHLMKVKKLEQKINKFLIW